VPKYAERNLNQVQASRALLRRVVLLDTFTHTIIDFALLGNSSFIRIHSPLRRSSSARCYPRYISLHNAGNPRKLLIWLHSRSSGMAKSAKKDAQLITFVIKRSPDNRCMN